MTTAAPAVPPRPSRPPTKLTRMDSWYFTCFTMLAKHLGRWPSVREIATYTRRDTATVWASLRRLVGANYLAQNARGTYVVPAVRAKAK